MVSAGLARLAMDVEQFHELAMKWPEPVWQWHVADNTVQWNPAWKSVFGIDPAAEQPSYESWLARIHPDDRDRVERSFRAMTGSTAQTWTEEYRFRLGDGTYANIVDHAVAHRDAKGRPVRFFGTMVNVSAFRIEAEARRRLAAIVESTTDFVGTGTPDGRIEYVNRSGRRMLEIGDSEDVTRFTFADFCPPELAAGMREKLDAANRHGVFSGEVTLLSRTGRRIPTSAVIIAHRDSGGAVTAISAIMRDTSQLRMLEAQLAGVQRLEAVGRLAGGVAHDFNSHLTAILAGAEVLLADARLSPDQRDEALAIRRSADRLAGLTRQLLAFGRRQRLHPRVIEVNEVVREMEDLVRSLVGSGIRVDLRLAPDAGRARVDPGQLEHVMINLVINAREAMPAGGTLTIATANVGFTEATLRSRPDAQPGPYVMVSVSDTGVGIAPELQERIFEPFFTTKAQGTGAGLGLATAYGILKQSGGHIWADSAPGRGTTFKVFLPRVMLAVDPRPEPVRAQRTEGVETVLLVEDEDAVRRVTARVLRSCGYNVLVASHGDAALGLAASHPGEIDLVLTDVVMPGMSGPMLAQRLRELRPGLKVMFMSGYTAEELGSDVPVLTKPFTPEELLSEVRTALEGLGNESQHSTA